MGNTNRRIECLIVFTVGFLLQSWAQDPFLAWNYESLLTDRKPSGVNPEFQIDSQGNFHLFYWDKNRDKLVYATKSSNGQDWEFEWVDSTTVNGFKSSVFIDDQETIHIAYLSNQGGLAWLNYAKKTELGWESEPVPINSDLGKYGFDEEFPIYAQASIDIHILDSNEPLITYFDGSSEPSVQGWCGSSSSGMANYYHDYELEMEVAFKKEGEWTIIDSLNVPYTGGGACLEPNGDRFGEFNQIVELKNGEYIVLTNSLHNNDLLAFQGQDELINWSFQAIDSVDRFASSGANAGQRAKESFDYINAIKSSDSVLHLIYGVSDLYGLSSPTTYIRTAPTGRRSFFYVRADPDSLLERTYTPVYQEMVARNSANDPNSHDGHYRSLFSLSTIGDDSVFIGHYNHTLNEIVFHSSFNAGIDWELDTLGSWQCNTPIKTQIWRDSLHAIFYDSFNDQLIWGTRFVGGGEWNIRPIFQAMRFGTLLASSASSQNGNTEIFTVFNESVSGQLYAGIFSLSSWEYQALEEPGGDVSTVWVSQKSNQGLWAAYSIRDSSHLKIARPENGAWTCQVVEDSVELSELEGAILGDTIHLIYFDLLSQSLKWARSSIEAPLDWKIQALDTTSTEPTGIALSLHVVDEKMFLGYRNLFNPLLKYASYNVENSSWYIDTLSTPEVYFVEENDLATDSKGNLVAVLREELTNGLILAKHQADSSWVYQTVPTPNNNFIGSPVKVYIDPSDRIWVTFSSVSNQNELLIFRQDPEGFWEDITVLNNRGTIAQNYEVHGLDESLFIIGQKTHPNDRGIGILWAEKALATPLKNIISQEGEFQIWPNPVEDYLYFSVESIPYKEASLSIFDLNGKRLLHKALSPNLNSQTFSHFIQLDFLPKGMYVCILETEDRRIVRKFIR